MSVKVGEEMTWDHVRVLPLSFDYGGCRGEEDGGCVGNGTGRTPVLYGAKSYWIKIEVRCLLTDSGVQNVSRHLGGS